MLEQIVKCIEAEKYLYSKHARDEMEAEEFGEIGMKKLLRLY
jgi:hypothetical protein